MIGPLPGERTRQQVADLYADIREGVFRYLITVGLDPASAEETVQEAFLRLYAALRDNETIAAPKNWVYRVAHNIAINTARRGGSQSAFSAVLESTVASQDASAEQQMIEKEWIEGFQDAIEHLSERQRTCLELRAQGMRYREIADVLEIKISTAAEFVRRGIEELKKWNRCAR